MASLLHRIGRWCARHHWATIAAWVAVLLVVGGAAGALRKPLTNEFDIPGSRFQAVLSTLKGSIPEAAGVNGTVVFSADTPFTEGQRAAVAAVVDQWEDMGAVTAANDPFALQQQIDDGQTRLAAGREKLANGEKELADARASLTAGEEKLTAGTEKAEDGARELDNGATTLAEKRAEIEAGAATLAAKQRELDAAAATLAAKQQEINAGAATLADKQRALDAGAATLKTKQGELDAAAQELSDKESELAAGEAALTSQQQALDASAADLAAQEKALGETAATLAAKQQELTAAAAELAAKTELLDQNQAALDQRRAQVEAAIADGTLVGAAADAARAEIAAAQTQVDQGRAEVAAGQAQVATGQQQVDAGLAQVEAGRTQIAEGKAKIAAGQAQITEAATKLADGRAKLEAGRTELESGRTRIAAEKKKLTDGQAQLDEAQAALSSGQAQLTAGKNRLSSGSQQLSAATSQLASGRAQLAAGEAKLDAARAELAQGRKDLDTARKDLDAGWAKLTSGEAELDTAREQLEAGARIAALTDGMRLVSPDETVAMSQIRFDSPSPNLDPAMTAEFTRIGNTLEAQGVRVDYSKEITQDLSSVMGPGEVIGLIVAALVLLLMLGSLVAAGLPLAMALVGVGVGLAVTIAATRFVDMNSTTPALALMLGLAVGIDYTLFILNRHRTQLAAGMPLHESIALATGTSGNAVTFAGMTVIIALAALTLTGIPFLGVMGLSAALTVAVAVLVAITLAPAVLSLAGDRVLPRRARDRVHRGEHLAMDEVAGGAHRDDRTTGWAALVVRRPWAAILGVLGAVALLAIPVGDLRLGLPDGSAEPPDSTAYATYDLVRDNFGAGANGPIIAVAELAQPVPADDEVALDNTQADIAEQIAAVAGVERVVPFGVSDDRATLAFQVVPAAGPAEEATVDLVRALDAQADTIGQSTGSTMGITGQTVANIDISQRLSDALPRYLAVVIGLSFILLLLVFRSLLVPLLATAGFLLSLAAAFGAVVAVYQLGHLSGVFQVHEPTAILSFLPILLIGVLFGLAMDYQVFIVSAMRESHVHGEDARTAVVTGFNHSARVVTAAAIIMISVFGGFVFSHLSMIRPIGLGLAMGVLVDAFLVRMTLTPAVLHLLGEKAWWLPGWLDRLLPDVDVEGAALERDLGITHESPDAGQDRALAPVG